MRVVFDSRPCAERRGIGRYARCLLDALRAEHGSEIEEGHRPRRADVFHSPWIDGAPLRSATPTVVTLHDLIPLKRPGQYLRFGVRFRLRYLAVQRATRVIVPTTQVRSDAVERLDLHPDRVRVIAEAVDPALTPRSAAQVDDVRRRYRLPERYLLWVGDLQEPDPRKRVSALARAPRELPLVLVGAAGRWALELANVTLTGRVSDDELAAIYTGAQALVLASDEEGFGLTPIEALACGTPVVASDVPAVREVLGQRATLVAVDNLEGLLAAGAAARRPAPQPPAWTWADAARATWEVYEAAAAAG
jgi:glycosyltransferase involved in cell wall biosynthesis